MGYAPDALAEVFEYVPSENPNWLRHHERRQAYEEYVKQARSRLRLVPDEEKKE